METSQEGEGAVASEPIENEDPWAEAEELFESSEGEVAQQEKVTESHLEPEADLPNYLKLNDLRVPGKYKEAVAERIKQVASEFEEKQKAAIEAATQELGDHKNEIVKLAKVFQDIARTPKDQMVQKIAQYIEQYGQNIGVDPSTAQALREARAENQQPSQVTIDTITRKYRDQMIQTSDPREFMELWERADLEKSQVMETQMMGKFGQLLKAYHDQFIAPDKQTLSEFRTKAEQDSATATYNSKKSSWNEAATSLKSKYPDFEKYQAQITKVVGEKKHLSAARDRLNQEESDTESRQSFLEDVYLAISRNDHIATAKRPRQSGLPPSSKYIHSTKSGGGNWKDAEAAFLGYEE